MDKDTIKKRPNYFYCIFFMSYTCVGMCTVVHMWSEHIWGVGSFPLPCGSWLLNMVVRLNSLLNDLDSKKLSTEEF